MCLRQVEVAPRFGDGATEPSTITGATSDNLANTQSLLEQAAEQQEVAALGRPPRAPGGAASAPAAALLGLAEASGGLAPAAALAAAAAAAAAARSTPSTSRAGAGGPDELPSMAEAEALAEALAVPGRNSVAGVMAESGLPPAASPLVQLARSAAQQAPQQAQQAQQAAYTAAQELAAQAAARGGGGGGAATAAAAALLGGRPPVPAGPGPFYAQQLPEAGLLGGLLPGLQPPGPQLPAGFPALAGGLLPRPDPSAQLQFHLMAAQQAAQQVAQQSLSAERSFSGGTPRLDLGAGLLSTFGGGGSNPPSLTPPHAPAPSVSAPLSAPAPQLNSNSGRSQQTQAGAPAAPAPAPAPATAKREAPPGLPALGEAQEGGAKRRRLPDRPTSSC